MTDTRWVDMFPHPGKAPPASEHFGPERFAYNDWVRAMRKHNVAKAVDALILREKMVASLDAVETIALTIGMMCLDGSLDTSGGILGGFF